MAFAVLVGLAIVAISVHLWWPSIFLVLAFVFGCWRLWKWTAHDTHALAYLPPPPPEKIRKEPRGHRADDFWIDDPDLPSALD